MPRFKVGGSMSFVTEVRAKTVAEAEQRAIKKAWREGSFYLDGSSVQQIVRRNGEDVVLEEGEILKR
jgi:hypothetical protein